MTFININPLSHKIKWKVVKLVQFKNYKGDILKKQTNTKRPCSEKRAWFCPLQTSNPQLYVLKHSVINKMELSFRNMFQKLSEFSSQAPTWGLVGLFEILAQINSKELQSREELIPKAQTIE